MPRPPKAPLERRSLQIGIRVTPAERLELATAASDAGVSLTEYVRSQALEGVVVVHAYRSLDPDILQQLRQYGIALNSLTRTANGNRRLPPEMAAIASHIAAFLDENIPLGEDLDPAAVRQLRRIGVNLTQLLGWGRPLALRALQQRVERLLMEVADP